MWEAEPEETRKNQSLSLRSLKFSREDNFNNMASEGYGGSPQNGHATEPGHRGRVIGESFLEEATLNWSLNSRRLSGSQQAHDGRGEEESFPSPA